jgi:ubiquinone biosynthesis protein
MPTALRRAYDSYRTGESLIRDANRLRQIVTVLVRHGFGALLRELQLDDRWALKKIFELTAAERDDTPIERRIVLAIHDLGPTFIKLGQILSTRGDLLPAELIAELETLQDAVPALPAAVVRGIVRAELGREVADLYEDFADAPLASASIAQVHAARLRDSGDEVVVKVQRPDLKEKIEADLEIMRYLAQALERNFPEARFYTPTGIVAQFERAIRKEIDFHNEVENINRFRANFAGVEGVHFPAPYEELSTARVLTMERIEGTKLSALAGADVDLDRVVRNGVDAVLKMIFEDGFFHGDLHPGNLLVRPDGTLCFLDFGLCGRLTPRQRDDLVDMMVALVGQDYSGVARTCWRLGERPPGGDGYAAFEADLTECLQRRFADKKIGEIEIGAFFADLIQLSQTHHIAMPPDYTMTFKAVMTMEGVAKQLVPDLDMLAAARPRLAELAARRFDPRRLVQSGYDVIRDLSDAAGDLQQISRAGLAYLRAAEKGLRGTAARDREWRRGYSAVQRRNRQAALAATSALCGVLVLGRGDELLFGLPAGALVFFVLAAVLGALSLGGYRR